MNNRLIAPTCYTGWAQVYEGCPECGPDGPCIYIPDFASRIAAGRLQKRRGILFLLIAFVCFGYVIYKAVS